MLYIENRGMCARERLFIMFLNRGPYAQILWLSVFQITTINTVNSRLVYLQLWPLLVLTLIHWQLHSPKMSAISYIQYYCRRSDCPEPSSPVTLIDKDENGGVIKYTPVELENGKCIEWRIQLGTYMAKRINPGMLLESCHHYAPYNPFQRLELPVICCFLFSLHIL